MRMRSAAVMLLTLAVLRAAPGGAASVCQKGKKVRLRPAACKGKEVTVADLGTDPSGIWKYREGTGLGDEETFAPAFLTLNPDGTGQLNLRQRTTQALRCTSLRYARGGGTPTLTLHLRGEAEVVQATRTADELRITDDDGTSVFDRVAAVEADGGCGTLTEVSRLTGLPLPFSGGGLAFDGTRFVYLDASLEPVAVDATTGAVGTPPVLASLGRMPFAAEGGDVWGLCGCGANDVAVRSAVGTGTAVDQVDTAAELGGLATIVSLAVPEPGRLLLLVRDPGGPTFTGRLLLADTSGEPDTLLSSVPFDLLLGSMALDGSTLWGFSGFGLDAAVVRVDPATGTANGTFLVPDRTVRWLALTAATGRLFLLGEARDGTGVIAAFAAPAP